MFKTEIYQLHKIMPLGKIRNLLPVNGNKQRQVCFNFIPSV